MQTAGTIVYTSGRGDILETPGRQTRYGPISGSHVARVPVRTVNTMHKIPQSRLLQSIFQIRYRLTLGAFLRILPTAEQFREYPDFQVVGTTQALLVDAARRCSLSIAPDACGYDQKADDAELESERIEQMLGRLPEGLQVQQYERIGYRRLYAVPVAAPLEDLLSLLRVKLIADSVELQKVLPALADHLTLRFQGRDETVRYTTSIASFSLPQLAISGPADGSPAGAIPEDLARVLPEVGLLVDIDAFQDLRPTPAHGAIGMVSHARSRLSSMMGDLVRYLFTVDLE